MKNYKKKSLGPLNYYLKPNYIYIPLEIQNDNNITLLVKKGDYVYKDTILGRKKDENKLSIYPSISGTVEDIKEELNSNQKLIKTLKIKNDFKECYQTKRKENKDININKEEFLKQLKKYSIIENEKIIYKELEKHYKKLIINACENDPYITSKETLLIYHADEILETIDKLIKITNSEECIILINPNSIKGIDSLNNYIGTYDRIKLEKNYNCPNSLTLDLETIYTIYETIKYDVPKQTKIITLSGDGFKKNQNILVKIGTKANILIEETSGYKRFNHQKMCLIAGDALTGTSMKNDNFIIDNNLNGILTIKKEETEEKPCIKCGKCINICPQKLNPLMLTHIKNKEKLKKLKIEKCLNCALCSYICPSKRNINKKIQEAKENIK